MLLNTTQNNEQKISNGGAAGPRSNSLKVSLPRCLVAVLVVVHL